MERVATGIECSGVTCLVEAGGALTLLDPGDEGTARVAPGGPPDGRSILDIEAASGRIGKRVLYILATQLPRRSRGEFVGM